IDAEGNVFFADSSRRIRAIRFGAVMAEPKSSVTATAGTPQIATTGRVFSVPFQITLMSGTGTPENGIRVDFAAPATGASCNFSNGASSISVLTDIDGHATATCTGNLVAGAYTVPAPP